jgi:hypothetical protein
MEDQQAEWKIGNQNGRSATRLADKRLSEKEKEKRY